MDSLIFHLHAVSVLAPGMVSLEALRDCSRRQTPPALPDQFQLEGPANLPANERRRAPQVVRLTQSCIEQVLHGSPFQADELRPVFATDEGTGEVCQQILATLATTGQVSPLQFPNSVLNAPSGYFAIAWANHQPANVVSLGLQSFASGLLCAAIEASCSSAPILFVCYDAAVPQPMNQVLPIQYPTATAWIISSASRRLTAPRLATLSLMLEHADVAPVSPWPVWLPVSWQANSSARALSALGLLDADSGSVFRTDLGTQILAVERLA